MNVEPTKNESSKLEESDSPSTEMTVQIQLDGLDPSKCVGKSEPSLREVYGES